MISKAVISKYLERKLESYNWIKTLSEDELDYEISLLSVKPRLKNRSLRKHQKASFLLGTIFNNWFYVLDMGAGKTMITLSLFDYWKQMGEATRCLVVVPSDANIEGWRDEVETYTNLSFASLYGTKSQRLKALQKGCEVNVINYAGLPTMMAELKYPTKASKKKEWVPNETMCEEFVSNFDFVIYDELQNAKGHDSLRFHLCDVLSENVKFRYGASGTPMNDPSDLWSEFYLIDRGETFGQSRDIFMEAYFNQVVEAYGVKQVFDARYSRDLMAKMRYRSIRYEESEFAKNLPPKNFTCNTVLLPDTAREHYRSAMQGVIESGDNRQELVNSYIKLRQICSGYLSFKSEETGEPIYIDFPTNPKIDLLVQLVREMPYHQKMIVFYNFTHTGELITQALREQKIHHRWLYGGTKDQKKVIRDFKEDPSIHVLVSQIKPGSAGHNLQVANRIVFFEIPDNCIDRKQAIKRIHRGDQKNICYYHDFIAKDTVDHRILEALARGINLHESIVDGKSARSLLGI